VGNRSSHEVLSTSARPKNPQIKRIMEQAKDDFSDELSRR
jgi:hypothetical protein